MTPASKKLLPLMIVPSVFYSALFFILTWPAILHFRTSFMGDMSDGFQNVWNIWWVRKAIVELHQMPFWTDYLHFPAGTSLLAHTMAPIRGLMGILFQPFLTQTVFYNFAVLFSFAVSGMTAYWISFYYTQHVMSSLFGGYVFTFCSYHFAHAQGHMNLITTEWIPLFLLSYIIFIKNPRPIWAIIAASCLSVVILCDYYYFFYCILAGIIALIWDSIRSGSMRRCGRLWLNMAVLISFAMLTSGWLVRALIRQNRRDPFHGAHDAAVYSMDLLAPFVPGGHWRFASLTKKIWSNFSGNIHENSLFIGWAVILMASLAWMVQGSDDRNTNDRSLWTIIFLFFFILALGPGLVFNGRVLINHGMPYSWLENLLPYLKISGCPARMMVMSMLAACVLSAMGFNYLWHASRTKRITACCLTVLLIFEYLPSPLPLTSNTIPDYVVKIREDQAVCAVMDYETPDSIAQYHQTMHQRKLATGFVARYPGSVIRQKIELLEIKKKNQIENLLYLYNINCIVTPDRVMPNKSFNIKVLYDDGKQRVYRLLPVELDTQSLETDQISNDSRIQCFIEACSGVHISGWAFLPEMRSISSTIYIILKNHNSQFLLSSEKLRRPDVSRAFGVQNRYDYSGFNLFMSIFDVPPGLYKIGILVLNQNHSGIRWLEEEYNVSS